VTAFSHLNHPKIQQNIWNHFGFVESMRIRGNNNIVQWPAVEFRNLNRLRLLGLDISSNLTGSLSATISDDEKVMPPQLQELSVVECGSLMEVPKLPASLEFFHMAICPKLESMPTILGDVKNLRVLKVDACDALTTFSDGMYGVTALKKLDIRKCPRLETLPEGLLQQLPALESLWIRDCPNLEEAFSRGGTYWNLVEAIPRRIDGLHCMLRLPSNGMPVPMRCL
jgi:hypothetical protein